MDGHARLSGRHLGEVCPGYAPNESFSNERFHRPFHPLLTTLLSLGQVLFVDHLFEVSDLAIVDSTHDDSIFIRSRSGDVIIFPFPLLPISVLVTVDDVVDRARKSITDRSEEEGPVATVLPVALPLPFKVGGICNVQMRLRHLRIVSIIRQKVVLTGMRISEVLVSRS
jgi:hypothetical protein